MERRWVFFCLPAATKTPRQAQPRKSLGPAHLINKAICRRMFDLVAFAVAKMTFPFGTSLQSAPEPC